MKCEHDDIIWNESQSIVWENGLKETGKPDIGTCQDCGKKVWAKDYHSEIQLIPERKNESYFN